MKTVGVISDTHSLLRPEALSALRGADHIVHAGDIGDPDILTALAAIAPVTAVRGNNDRGPWANALPETAVLELEGCMIYVLHDVGQLDLDPAAAGFSAVIAGHSHRPLCESRGPVLFFNPGSAGPRRFRLPIAIGHLHVDRRQVRGDIHLLDDVVEA
jgi:putative phosphoesterase